MGDLLMYDCFEQGIFVGDQVGVARTCSMSGITAGEVVSYVGDRIVVEYEVDGEAHRVAKYPWQLMVRG